MCLPDDLQLKYQNRKVFKGIQKIRAKFAQKLYTQKPLFLADGKVFFLFEGAMKKIYTKTLKKVFHIFYGCYDSIRLWNKIPIKRTLIRM